MISYELGADAGDALGDDDVGDIGDAMSSVTSAVAMAMRLETTLALAMMPLSTLAVTMWAMHLAAGAEALRDFGGDDLCCAELFGDVGDWRFDSIRFDSIDWIGWKVSQVSSA